MASAPSDAGPVLGRIDAEGRLISADPPLEQLQSEAGSGLGAPVALPQLAAIVRLAQRLRIPVSRRVLAAGKDQDIDMWVRAVPEGEEVALSIEQWTARPAAPARLATIAAVNHETLGPAALGWSVDDKLRVVDLASAFAEMLSVDPVSVSGQPLTRLFRLEETEDGEMPLLAALAARSSFSGQLVKDRSTGRQLVLSGEAVTGADGAFAGFEGSAVPAGQPMQSVGSAPAAAVDSAIHSALRSPLDNIVRSAEAMIGPSGEPAPDEYSAYAADIAAAARHLLSVISSLGENGGSQSQEVELPALASEAIALLESAARDRSIVVAVQPMRSLKARGEARNIVQILVNLIGNAVRYSAEGTAVTLSFEKANGSALVHVADEGPGIDPADQERLFQPFEQGDVGNGGSGLGLSIARRLARAMGGDIRLESAPGRGSRFSLVLPVS